MFCSNRCQSTASPSGQQAVLHYCQHWSGAAHVCSTDQHRVAPLSPSRQGQEHSAGWPTATGHAEEQLLQWHHLQPATCALVREGAFASLGSSHGLERGSSLRFHHLRPQRAPPGGHPQVCLSRPGDAAWILG